MWADQVRELTRGSDGFRVPERRTPTRLSLNEALDYVLRGSISADYQNHEIGWLLHQAYTRLLQFAMTPPHFRDAVMQPLPQFTIDPVLVAKAILDGIESRALSVDDLPPEFLAIWQARPFVSDWSLGFVNFAREGKREGRTVSDKRRFRPTLLLDEVDACLEKLDLHHP